MKKKFAAGISVLLILLADSVVLNFYKSRDAVSVTAVRDTAPADVCCYCQTDERWRDDKMGSSKYTLGSSGCITTCLASVCRALGKEVTPGSLNKYLSDIKVYDSDGNILWDALEKALGVTVIRESAADINSDKLSAYISDGKYPIVCVHMPLTGKNHYVLLIGSRDGSFLCMDPLNADNKAVSLEKYGNKIYAVRTIVPSTSAER